MTDDTIIAERAFYSKGEQYWSDIPATINGMLGGFSEISDLDINTSRNLLRQLYQSKTAPGKGYALDCGAGIGRISENLLIPWFQKVDLAEQNENFLNRARINLGKDNRKVGKYYATGLQNFIPQEGKYDVIWCQWVLGHLTDEDLIKFLIRCKSGLKENGLIVLKENITSSGNVETDEEDSSVTRPFSLFMKIFEKARVNCYIKQKQKQFPKDLYSVYMFVLKPLIVF